VAAVALARQHGWYSGASPASSTPTPETTR
jgi:hypothetical protein